MNLFFKMKQSALLFLVFSGLFPTFLFAQWRNTKTAAYQRQVAMLDTIESPANELSLPVTLPLVFHLVYPKQNDAPSREVVEWQVAQLNKHFSLEEFKEKQAIFGESVYDALAVDTEISFCLDKIFFTPSDSTNFSAFNTIKNDNTKGATPFKPQEYINIWVGQLVDNSGFAQLPGGLWETDGIVIDVAYFGHATAPYNEGKTLTHLLGNYLGLQSLWGNRNWDSENIVAHRCEDDGVNDTPIHNAPNYNKVKAGENHISLCDGFKKEMYMNYMDNTVDSMLYMFTVGQKERMHDYLRKERNLLLQSSCNGAQIQPQIRTIVAVDDLPVGLSVAPNPVSNQLIINYYDKANPTAILEIHNALGALVYREKIGTTYRQTLATQDWTAGLYVISVKGFNPYSLKVIKQ